MYVPTPRLICFGLNAPALLFKFLDPFSWGLEWDRLPRSLLGFDMMDLCFLLGVVVVWYLVGMALDRWRTACAPKRRGLFVTIALYVPLLALAVLLLYLGLHDLGPQQPENFDPPVGAYLTLLWSVALTLLSGKAFLLLIRPTFRGPVQKGARH